MDSLRLPTSRAIDDCSPKQPTIFYLLLTRRTICDMPSTVAGTREAPSMLHVNDDMRTRSAAGRSTTGITTSQLGVRPPESSQRRTRLAVLPRDGRGTTTTTPLPGIDIIPDDRKIRVECLPLLCNTPGVTLARTHLDTKNYNHMWKNLRDKSMRALES
jgi:hypothetical protein